MSRNERAVLAGSADLRLHVPEIVGGVLSGSLALIADAGHMMTDAPALAWAGFHAGLGRGHPRRRDRLGDGLDPLAEDFSILHSTV